MTPTRTPRFGLQEHQVFWNEEGAIVCACCHLPHPGSDTWRSERWQEITPESVIAIEDAGGHVACEGCGKVPSRIVRATIERR
ncbi:MAG: hypothetical protein R3E97_24805 [Candidatus Eisenbacteria bacterium]